MLDADMQLRLAKYAGREWYEKYRRHLGMVHHPLPFERFKRQVELVRDMRAADPNGGSDIFRRAINEFCISLGS